MGNHIFAQKDIHMIIWTKNLLKNYNAFSYDFLVCLFLFNKIRAQLDFEIYGGNSKNIFKQDISNSIFQIFFVC